MHRECILKSLQGSRPASQPTPCFHSLSPQKTKGRAADNKKKERQRHAKKEPLDHLPSQRQGEQQQGFARSQETAHTSKRAVGVGDDEDALHPLASPVLDASACAETLEETADSARRETVTTTETAHNSACGGVVEGKEGDVFHARTSAAIVGGVQLDASAATLGGGEDALLDEANKTSVQVGAKTRLSGVPTKTLVSGVPESEAGKGKRAHKGKGKGGGKADKTVIQVSAKTLGPAVLVSGANVAVDGCTVQLPESTRPLQQLPPNRSLDLAAAIRGGVDGEGVEVEDLPSVMETVTETEEERVGEEEEVEEEAAVSVAKGAVILREGIHLCLFILYRCVSLMVTYAHTRTHA